MYRPCLVLLVLAAVATVSVAEKTRICESDVGPVVDIDCVSSHEGEPKKGPMRVRDPREVGNPNWREDYPEEIKKAKVPYASVKIPKFSW